MRQPPRGQGLLTSTRSSPGSATADVPLRPYLLLQHAPVGVGCGRIRHGPLPRLHPHTSRSRRPCGADLREQQQPLHRERRLPRQHPAARRHAPHERLLVREALRNGHHRARSLTPSTRSRSATATPTPPPAGPASPPPSRTHNCCSPTTGTSTSSTAPASSATPTRTSSPSPSLLAGSGVKRHHHLPPLSASAAPSPPAPVLEATTMPPFPSRRSAGPTRPAKTLGLFRPARPEKWPDRPCLGCWPGPAPGSARPGRHDVPCRPDPLWAVPGMGPCRARPAWPVGHV